MFKFNSENILTGQIKQKLADFNLPKYRIYTKAQEEYVETHGTEIDIVPTLYTNAYPSYANRANVLYDTSILYAPYIKDNIIQEYMKIDDGTYEWRPYHFGLKNHDKLHDTNRTSSSNVKPYLYNVKELNYTRNLQIKNNIYDSYTHEYLGDYLRFQRDYNNINLMSLYNCFSNRTADSLELKFKVANYTDIDNIVEMNIEFDTKDVNYKILSIPVKMFKKYTIAMQCDSTVEICCGMYGVYQDKRQAFAQLPSLTYKYFNNMQFNAPVLYETLTYDNLHNSDNGGELLINNIAQSECNLKMFIKIPASTKSSIVILEGDYRDFNDSALSITGSKLIRTSNYSVINYENNNTLITSGFKSPLQLLQMNTGESYPFADRLIEYLTDNMITPEDEINDNIKRVKQTVALSFVNGKKSDTADNDAEEKLTDMLSTSDLWNPIIAPTLYSQMIRDHNTFELNRDILGYCDRDTEKYFKGFVNEKENITIANIDIYESEDKVHEWQ